MLVLLRKARKHRFASVRDFLTIFDPKVSVMFRVTISPYVGIALKISENLPGMLATPRAKFHADRWSPGGENHVWTKKRKKTHALAKCISFHSVPQEFYNLVVPGGYRPTSLDKAFMPVLRANYFTLLGSIVFPLFSIKNYKLIPVKGQWCSMVTTALVTCCRLLSGLSIYRLNGLVREITPPMMRRAFAFFRVDSRVYHIKCWTTVVDLIHIFGHKVDVIFVLSRYGYPSSPTLSACHHSVDLFHRYTHFCWQWSR